MAPIVAFRRLGFFLLFFLIVCHADAQSESLHLKLPLERFSHGFTLHYIDSVSGGEMSLSPQNSEMAPIGWVNGSGQYLLDGDSHLALTFLIDGSQYTQRWLSDDLTGELSEATAFTGDEDLRSSAWYIGSPYSVGGSLVASNMRCFSVGEDRFQHSLALVLSSGSVYPVSRSAVMGENVVQGNGNNVFQSYGFFNAWSYPDNWNSGLQAYLFDVTQGEQSPADTASLVSAQWTPTGQSMFIYGATGLVASADSSAVFTFHTSSGSLQSLTPFWSSGYDPESNSYWSGYVISGYAGVGESYWFTRDSDGASSTPRQMLWTAQFTDLTVAFPDPPTRNLQSYTFQVGSPRNGHALAVHQTDGYVTYLYVAPWNWQDANTLTSYDSSGNAFTYYYTDYVADVDSGQSWWLMDETTGEYLGSTQTVLDGYNPYAPPVDPPPTPVIRLLVNEARHGHSLILRENDGSVRSIVPDSGYEGVGTYLSAWQTYSDSTGGERTLEIRYFPVSANFDPAQSFSLVDQTTGEEMLWDIPGAPTTAPTFQWDSASQSYSADLSRWYLPAVPITLNISATRWTHDLMLCQPNGVSFALTKGNLQGSWSVYGGGFGWFTTYNYFDATSAAQPGLDWWVYDTTSGEVSASNQSDLTQWLGESSNVDADGDGLPDWYEFIAGSDPYGFNTPPPPFDPNADDDWDGIPNGWEVAHGLNPNDSSDAWASAAGQPGLTNLQVYQGIVLWTFKVPIGRVGHAFSLHAWTYWGGDAGYPWQSGINYGLWPKGTVDSGGHYHVANDSYFVIQFPVDPSAVTQWWLSDDTTGDGSQINTLDLRTTPWAPGVYIPQNSTPASLAVYAALPMSRFQHNLVIAYADGSIFPMTQGNEQGGDTFNPVNGERIYHASYGFFTAAAYPDHDGGSFHIIDTTSSQQAPANLADLTLATWGPISLSGMSRSVAIQLSDTNAGGTFTFHGSQGSLQTVTAYYTGYTEPQTGSYVTGWFVFGSAGVGENFWLTRDSDGSQSPQLTMGINDMYVDWTGYFAPVRYYQTIEFQIGGPRAGHTLMIQQADGYTSGLYNTGSGSMTTWNDDGAEVVYTYYTFQGTLAVLDLATPSTWWLIDQTTGENLGGTTMLLEGWEPWHPSPPAGFVSLTINQARHGHSFRIQQDDGTAWNVSAASGYESPDAYLQTWMTFYAGTPEERTQEIQYYPANAPFDPNQGFTVTDLSTGEQVAYPSMTWTVDLSLWYLPANPLALKVSVTRWTHELLIHQGNGESFTITRGNLQGSWSQDPDTGGWFISSSYFDATASVRPGLDFWVYDVTTGETSPVNVTDLSQWGSSDMGLDSDGDGLPDWYEFVLGTDSENTDTDGDGLSDGIEARFGLNPLSPFDPGIDSDHNGLSDWWELKHFGHLGVDPTEDTDGDGLTNLQEYTYHTDPLDLLNQGTNPLADSDNNGLGDWWEILHFGHIGNDPTQVVPGKGGLNLLEIFNNRLDLEADSTVNDGIPDSWKIQHNLDCTDPNVANQDADWDGLTNSEEYNANSDPQNWDTDQDGTPDGADLHPLIPDPSAPSGAWVTVPSWDEQAQAESPDYSQVDFTSVEVHWNESTNSPAGYRIERRTDSDIWQPLGQVGGGTTSKDDQGLLANRHYQYRVIAYTDAGGVHIESPAASAEYAVPLNLQMSVKQSSLSRGKQGFAEFTNPSTPPKFYLVSTTTSSMQGSSETSDATSSSSSSYSGDYSFTQTINPLQHSRSNAGEYSSTSDSNSSGENYSNYSSSATSSSYHWLTQGRTKENTTATTQGDFTASNSYHAGSTSGTSSSSWFSLSDYSGDFLSNGTFVPNEGEPRWLGNDYNLYDGDVVWSGNSDYSADYGSDSGSNHTLSTATQGEGGSWSGSSTYSWSYGGSSGSNTSNLYGAPWAGSWGYTGWFGNTVSTTPTEIHYQSSSSSSNSSYTSEATVKLTEEYATDAFRTDVIHDMPDYPDDWTENWYGWGYYNWGYYGYDSYWGYGGWWYGGYPYYGWWAAERHLNASETSYSVSKMKYKFKASPSAPYTMKWNEVFVPDDDLSTPDVDESKQIQIVRERSWQMGGGQNESPEYEIDPSTEPAGRNGYYTILFQPAHLGTPGVGEAGKDIAGDDSSPGKVVLINDDDMDGDGVVDYADGYSYTPSVDAETTSYGVSFTPVGVSLAAIDPENARIKFSYSESDPQALSASQNNKFVLPGSGRIRLWKKDGWEQRDGHSVGEGGDLIKPGVPYSFEELGISSSYSAFTVYVEAVKTSQSVADIPIKVEYDPTGSMGFRWSDQLRFTATRISWLARSYGESDFTEVNGPGSSIGKGLENTYSNYELTPNVFGYYKVQIEDPRSNLGSVTVNNVPIPLDAEGPVHKSAEFVPIQPGTQPDDGYNGLLVPQPNGEYTVEYNPGTSGGSGGRYVKVPADFEELAAAITAAEKLVTQGGYDGTPQQRGIDIAERAALLLKNDGLWVYSVRVDAQGTIVAIGGYPPLTPTTTPPITGTTEADFVRLKKKQKLKVGMKWPAENVERIHEVKVSISGRVSEDQKTRLLGLVGNNEEKLFITVGRYEINGAGGRVFSRLFKVTNFALKYLNCGATSAFTVFQMIKMNDQMDQLAEAVENYRRVGSDSPSAFGYRVEIEQHLREFLTNASPDAAITGLLRFKLDAMFIEQLGNILDSE